MFRALCAARETMGLSEGSLAVLVEAGLVIRGDSPNGRRYARKGQGGEMALALGFDLSPLVAHAQERTLRHARERLTLPRRDLAMIATRSEERAALPGSPSSWTKAPARCGR